MTDNRGPGRPNKFTNLRSLQNAINKFFDECDGTPRPDGEGVMKRTTLPRPYTVSGLARALGTSRRLLCNIETLGHYDAEFIHTIKDAKQRCEIWVEENLLTGGIKPAAGIFVLKNNHDWKDESEKVIRDTRSPADLLEKRRKQVTDARKEIEINPAEGHSEQLN